MKKVATFGQRLRTIMREEGMKYREMGRRLEQSPQTINRYVLGQREPRAETVTDIALRLGVDIYWLQGYDVPREPSPNRPGDPNHPVLPILGVIKAGIPTLSAQEVLGYAPAQPGDDPKTDFFLRVSGDSMKNAGIQDGDLVQIHQQASAYNGQIVACIVNGEDATLKRFHRQGDFIVLQPENPDYEPRIVPAQAFDTGEARVVGVAVRLMRDL